MKRIITFICLIIPIIIIGQVPYATEYHTERNDNWRFKSGDTVTFNQITIQNKGRWLPNGQIDYIAGVGPYTWPSSLVDGYLNNVGGVMSWTPGIGFGTITGLDDQEILFGKSDGTIDQHDFFTYDNVNFILRIGDGTGGDPTSGQFVATNGTSSASLGPQSIGVSVAGTGTMHMLGNYLQFQDGVGNLFNIGRAAWSTDETLLFPAAKGALNQLLYVSNVSGDDVTLSWSNIATLGAGTFVPLTRTLTINGTTQDLSANRTWNVGDVLTSGSYSDPSWITSIAASKVTATIDDNSIATFVGNTLSYTNKLRVNSSGQIEMYNALTGGDGIDGSIFIGDDVSGVWQLGNITAGTGISVTNGAGSITIANSGVVTEVDGSISNEGSLTVLAGTGATSIISSNTSGSTSVTIQGGTGIGMTELGNTIGITNTGDTNAADDLTTSTTFGGDVSGTYNAITVTDDSHSHSATTISTNIVSSVDGVTNDGGDIDLVAGSNVTITPNDGANTITVASSYKTIIGSMPQSVVSASTTAFAPIFSQNNFNATESNRQMIMPFDGTASNLYVVMGTSQPASGSMVVTVRKNGVATTLTLTIAANAAAATFTDTTNSFTFVAGDKISIQFVNNATGNSGGILSASLMIQ